MKWKMLLLVIAIIVSCTATTTAAVPVTISGMVRDAVTGGALPSASVVLVGTPFGSASDLEGMYAIRNVPPGTYTLRASYVGYTTKEVSVTVTEAENLVHDFALDPVAVEGEVVIVTAQAKGQKEAINEQLAANQIVNVVSAARIQELPDANAAEAVGRLPGVAILRTGGEGNQVVVRGLQPKYNTISVDGVRMSSSQGGDRGADLSMISPYMLEGIEVSKTVTPDQDPDVLGGSVNFKMKEAAVGKEGLGISLMTQGGYTGLSNAPNKYNNYKIVGSVEGRFFQDQSLGVFAQADIERRNLSSNEYGGTFAPYGNSITDYLTTAINLRDVLRDRQRANGTLVLDWRFPDGKVVLSNFGSSGSTYTNNRNQLLNTSSSANFQNYALNYQKSTVNMVTNALAFDGVVENLRLVARASHAYTETKNPEDWTATFQQGPAVPSSFIGATNVDPWSLARAAVIDTNGTTLTGFVNNDSYSRERALTASLDIEGTMNFGDQVSATLKFGGKYRDQTRSYDYNQYTGQGLGLTSARLVDSIIASLFPSTAPYMNTYSIPIRPFLDDNFSYGTFLGGDFDMHLPLNFGMLNTVARHLRNNANVVASLPGASIAYFYDSFNSTVNDYAGDEKQGALYAMATVNIGSDLTVIPGVRYQQLQTTYTASQGHQTAASATGGPYFHVDTTVTVRHSYWLPDVSVRYKPTSWCDVRLSYTNTLAYPDYNAIVPRIDVTLGPAITWNNAHLAPSRSTNYDAYVSFYDNTLGLLTVGSFLKRIGDLIYPSSFYVSDTAALAYYPAGQPPASPPTTTFNIVSYVNNPNRVDDWGFEIEWQTHFWYLPKPLDGLVLNVNYTHTFSKAVYPITLTRVVRTGRLVEIIHIDTSYVDRLLFQPNTVVNLSLGYDFGGFSARISMLYQDDLFTGPNLWPQTRTTTSAYRRWDLSVKQNLPYGFQIYGDINNINGANDRGIIQRAQIPVSEQSYGPSADLGLRWQF